MPTSRNRGRLARDDNADRQVYLASGMLVWGKGVLVFQKQANSQVFSTMSAMGAFYYTIFASALSWQRPYIGPASGLTPRIKHN